MNSPGFTKYTVTYNPADIPALYSDWDWLIDQKYLNDPWLMSCFGDLFFKAPDASIHFLDSLEGTITPFAENEDKAKEKLADHAAQKRYLTSETVDVLKERNITLKEDELYIYVPHPVVAGRVDINTVQVMSMKVVISLNGQLLRQVHRSGE